MMSIKIVRYPKVNAYERYNRRTFLTTTEIISLMWGWQPTILRYSIFAHVYNAMLKKRMIGHEFLNEGEDYLWFLQVKTVLRPIDRHHKTHSLGRYTTSDSMRYKFERCPATLNQNLVWVVWPKSSVRSSNDPHLSIIGPTCYMCVLVLMFIALLFEPAQRPLTVIKVKNDFEDCLRTLKTLSIYATEFMKWVNERTANLFEILKIKS